MKIKTYIVFASLVGVALVAINNPRQTPVKLAQVEIITQSSLISLVSSETKNNTIKVKAQEIGRAHV